MRLLFNIKNQEIIEIHLIKDKFIIDKTHLTVGQDFDILLIDALDKIFSRNKIGRLSLKSVEISGEIEPNRVASMILSSIASALKV